MENKLNELGTIAFRCNDTFVGMYKAEREQRFGKRAEIHSAGETFLLYNDKIINTTGDRYYRVNDVGSLFFEGMVLIGSIARAITEGILEEECSMMLKNFFKDLRKRLKEEKKERMQASDAASDGTSDGAV